MLTATTTTPTAGVGDNLTITAKDTYGNVATGYTGSKNLTFSGAHAQGANNPTVSNSSGSAINFGSSTAITFSSGVSTVSGSANGVMTLYKTETVSITVTDGSINNGAGLSVTVGSATANQLVFVQGPGPAFTGIAMSPAVTVQVEDVYGNTVADNGLSITLAPSTGSISSGATVSTNSSGAGDLLLDDLDPDLPRDHAHRRADIERHRDLRHPAFVFVQRDGACQQRRPAHRPRRPTRAPESARSSTTTARATRPPARLPRHADRNVERLLALHGHLEQPAHRRLLRRGRRGH